MQSNMRVGRSSSAPVQHETADKADKKTETKTADSSSTSDAGKKQPPALSRSSSEPAPSTNFDTPNYHQGGPVADGGSLSRQNSGGGLSDAANASMWDLPEAPGAGNAGLFDLPEAPGGGGSLSSLLALSLPEAPSAGAARASDTELLGLEARLAALGMPASPMGASNVGMNPREPSPDYLPPRALPDATIDLLRLANQGGAGENLGMRFGRSGDEGGFKGDAYSLVPSAIGNNPELTASMASRMSDSVIQTDDEFSRSVGSSIFNGVGMVMSESLNDGASVRDTLSTMEDRLNVVVADMGSGPRSSKSDTYSSVNGSHTTPKFGRREVGSDAIQSQIRLTGDPSAQGGSFSAVARDQDDLRNQMRESKWAIDPDASLLDQKFAVQDFLTERLSELLNDSLVRKHS